MLSIIYHLRRVEDELEPPERPPPLLLPPLKPPDERVDEDDGRYVDELRVDDDELRTVDDELRLVVVDEERTVDDEIEREGAEIALFDSLDVVGRAGNADVDVLRRCVLTAEVEVVLFVEVEAPRTVEVETFVSLARRTAADVVEVEIRLADATFAATRDELFTLRRSFSLPRAT